MQFTAIGHFSDSSTMDLTEQVVWSSSIQTVASVSNTPGTRGLATAIATGSTQISADHSGITSSTSFSVTPAELLSLKIEPVDPTIQKTKTIQFFVYGHYTDSTTKDLTGLATWSSSNPSVLSISDTPGSKGLATGVDTGQSTVLAKYVSCHDTTTATVTELMLTKWANNFTDEPKVITSTDTIFTLAWPPLDKAVKYEIYYIPKIDPFSETLLLETAGTQIDVTENNLSYLRIKAKDAADSILDTWVIRGSSQRTTQKNDGSWAYIIPAIFSNGKLQYDFDEPTLPSYFYLHNEAQIELEDGYVQLNQNVTDKGPDLGVGYDSAGKKFLHIRFKYYQHRDNDYYGGSYCFPIHIISFFNQCRFLGIGNQHEDQMKFYGTNYWYRDHNPNDFIPYTETRQQIHPDEFFDIWITWDFKIDLFLGKFNVELFDSSMDSIFTTTIDTGWNFGDKIFLFFSPFGWWTGHYVRISDLLMESADTPF